MTLQDVFEECEKRAAWCGESIATLGQRNWLQDTPLHTVCSWGELVPTEVLIAAGADVNARGDKGSTPLFNAVGGGNAEVVRLLIKHGADPTLTNEWGRAPLEYAINVGAPADLVEVLRKAKPARSKGRR